MPLIFEYSTDVKNRKNAIPKNIRDYSSALYNALDKLNVPKNKLKGLKTLATTDVYNQKGPDSKTNGKKQNVKYITTNDATTRLQRDGEYDITKGGKIVHDFLKQCVAKSTRQEKVSPVDPPKPTSNAKVKPQSVKQEKITTPNGKITYTVTAESKKIYIDEKKLLKIKNKLV